MLFRSISRLQKLAVFYRFKDAMLDMSSAYNSENTLAVFMLIELVYVSDMINHKN